MITFSRAGEDNKSFRVTDIDSTFAGFAGADYDLQARLSHCHSDGQQQMMNCRRMPLEASTMQRITRCAHVINRTPSQSQQTGPQANVRLTVPRIMTWPLSPRCAAHAGQRWSQLLMWRRQQAHPHGGIWLRCAGNELPVHDHGAERQSVCLLRKEPYEAVEHGREDDEEYTEQFSHDSQVLRKERTRCGRCQTPSLAAFPLPTRGSCTTSEVCVHVRRMTRNTPIRALMRASCCGTSRTTSEVARLWAWLLICHARGPACMPGHSAQWA